MRYIYRFKAMSTPCELQLYCSEKSRADTIAESVLQEVKRLEIKYSYYNKGSLLSQINQREVSLIDSETQMLLNRAKRYYHLTKGVFDITIATIKPLYYSKISLERLYKEKERLLIFTGCEHFELKKGKILFDNTFTQIDLGGFVKEYAVDRTAMIIKKSKIESALINFGGDIYAIGRKPNGEKFSIGIKDPRDPKKYIHSIAIENESLTTSASYARNYKIEDQNFSHILTKKEYYKSPSSVTVVSKNCVESGVFSTSLMIDSSIKTEHKVFLI